jgi:hypothetical protein
MMGRVTREGRSAANHIGGQKGWLYPGRHWP